MAGGVALNCTMNGKITRETPFERVYIQPAAYDAGTSLGAALYVRHHVLGQPRDVVMDHVYWGLEYSPRSAGPRSSKTASSIVSSIDDEALARRDGRACWREGNIVGWFQGRFEWGPRALGNRSINCDPRNPRMKDILNHRIKHREAFRPFAPSVTAESASRLVRARSTVAVHADHLPGAAGQARRHSGGDARRRHGARADRDAGGEPRYWALMQAFERVTGVPVLLNTSFNENEPIVNTPDEAVCCFLRNDMDMLVLGPYLVVRRPGDVTHA